MEGAEEVGAEPLVLGGSPRGSEHRDARRHRIRHALHRGEPAQLLLAPQHEEREVEAKGAHAEPGDGARRAHDDRHHAGEYLN